MVVLMVLVCAVWHCLLVLVFLFCDRKGLSFLSVNLWLLKIPGERLKCFFLSIVVLVRTTECLIIFAKLWGAFSRSILILSFILLVISTVTTLSGWIHVLLMPMMWLLLTLALLLTVLNWSMGPLTEMVAFWILFWRMCWIYAMWVFRVMLGGLVMLLEVTLKLSSTVDEFDVALRVPLKSRVNWNAICLALSGHVGKIFSGVRPWFRILKWLSV